MTPVLSISVVSHLQIGMVHDLLKDLATHLDGMNFEFLLTLNLEERVPFSMDEFPFPIRLIHNTQPKGFGANHNYAGRQAAGEFFCVMNPDIRLESNPFVPLMAGLDAPQAGVVAPLVLDSAHRPEDSARRFPTPLFILKKAMGIARRMDYELLGGEVYPDWVGGMFMVFRRSVFQSMNGFDERYFMYYEDVDLCARLRLAGYKAILFPHAHVVHLARRSSHRSLRYMGWHLASMMRFFLSPVFWRVQLRFTP